MSEPAWIGKAAMMLLQSASLAEHGGRPGLRDEGLLDSALARARNLYSYEGVTDVARLAAAYAFGIVRNHPFVDGNKRAAFLAIYVFVAKNGYRLAADKVDAARTIFALAAGELGEEDLASWIRGHLAGLATKNS